MKIRIRRNLAETSPACQRRPRQAGEREEREGREGREGRDAETESPSRPRPRQAPPTPRPRPRKAPPQPRPPAVPLRPHCRQAGQSERTARGPRPQSRRDHAFTPPRQSPPPRPRGRVRAFAGRASSWASGAGRAEAPPLGTSDSAGPAPSPPCCVRAARRAGAGFRNGTEGRAAAKAKAKTKARRAETA